jgi:hypothetical protein
MAVVVTTADIGAERVVVPKRNRREDHAILGEGRYSLRSKSLQKPLAHARN